MSQDLNRRRAAYWDKQAARYDRAMNFWDRHLFGDSRPWACGRAPGDVLEVAVGTGRNLSFYPEGARIAGVDWSPAMLGIARERAAALGRGADLRQGDAQALDFPDESFDTVLCALGLCAIPDDRRAVTEMARVLRPGGRLLLIDHVAAPASALRGGSGSTSGSPSPSRASTSAAGQLSTWPNSAWRSRNPSGSRSASSSASALASPDEPGCRI